MRVKVPPSSRDFFLAPYLCMSALTDHIRTLVDRILSGSDVYVVDIVVRGERSSTVVEVFIDTDDGVTLERCSTVSRELAVLLDEENVIKGRYRLDVSSPGLARPLTMPRQYRKNIGRACTVTVRSDSGTVKHDGTLTGVTERSVTVKVRGKDIDILYADIVQTIIVPTFK